MKWFSFPRLFQRRNRRKTPSAPEGMAEPPKAKQADEPNAQPEKALIDNIQLTSGYTDADGGYQAMDVMAEAIQSQPEVAVKDAWGAGFSIGTDGTLVVPTT